MKKTNNSQIRGLHFEAVDLNREPIAQQSKCWNTHNADQTWCARMHSCTASVTVVLHVPDLKSWLFAPRIFSSFERCNPFDCIPLAQLENISVVFSLSENSNEWFTSWHQNFQISVHDNHNEYRNSSSAEDIAICQWYHLDL